MAANRYAIKPHETTASARSVISQPPQEARIRLARREEADQNRRVQEVAHILTKRAKVTRFSVRRRSGMNPATVEPGAPVLPPGGVTPPGPAK